MLRTKPVSVVRVFVRTNTQFPNRPDGGIPERNRVTPTMVSVKDQPLEENRELAPFLASVRNWFMGYQREHHTSSDQAKYEPHTRFANDMSSHNQEPPILPGGVSHQLKDNHYHLRDGRRAVTQPRQIEIMQQIDDKEASEHTKAPPTAASNFGLSMPTPGFGLDWTRSKKDEMPHTQLDTTFDRLEQYDTYFKAAP